MENELPPSSPLALWPLAKNVWNLNWNDDFVGLPPTHGSIDKALEALFKGEGPPRELFAPVGNLTGTNVTVYACKKLYKKKYTILFVDEVEGEPAEIKRFPPSPMTSEETGDP